MTCKDSIILLIDELMNLFEYGNKLIYKKLLLIRHTIRNEYEPEQIHDICQKFFLTNDVEKKNMRIFKNTPWFDDIEYMWSDISSANKNLVWMWIESISKC